MGLLAKLLSLMVARDGIEPPTPAFSVCVKQHSQQLNRFHVAAQVSAKVETDISNVG